MKTLEFIYQETQIHFLLNPSDNNVMVNATEMAKPFNKEVRSFLRLDGTQKFIETLLKNENIRTDVYGYSDEKINNIHADENEYLTEKDIVITNNKAGTLMHRKLALKFASWLDVEFELWIIETIESILFGHLKEFKDLLQKEVEAKQSEKQLKQNLIEKPTPESVNAYFLNQELQKQIKSKKRKVVNAQLSLFENELETLTIHHK